MIFFYKFLFFPPPQIIQQQHWPRELPLEKSPQITEVLTNRPEALASAKLTVRKGTSLLQALGVLNIPQPFSGKTSGNVGLVRPWQKGFLRHASIYDFQRFWIEIMVSK